VTQEFFSHGMSVEVLQIHNPLAEDEDDLIVQGYVVDHNEIGLLLDGVEGEDGGQIFIPWSNIAQVITIEFEEESGEEEILP